METVKTLDERIWGEERAVARLCRKVGCRPMDRSKSEPCSRCGTHQAYGPLPTQWMGAAMRWAYRPEVMDELLNQPDPFLAALEERER